MLSLKIEKDKRIIIVLQHRSHVTIQIILLRVFTNSQVIIQKRFLQNHLNISNVDSQLLCNSKLQRTKLFCRWVGGLVSCSVMSDSLLSHELQPVRLLYPWDSPGKNTGVDCRSCLQRIFLTQGLNPGLLHCRQILHHLNYREETLSVSWSFYRTNKLLANWYISQLMVQN